MGDDLIRDYLSDLDTALTLVPASARARAAIVTEIGDGLFDAITDQLDRGCPPAQAARRVIDDFGAAALVAAQFVPILAARQVHRCALVLLRTGPLVGALWLATALLAMPVGLPIAAPVAILAAIMVGLALVTAVPCFMFAVTVTGRGNRRWSVPPRRAAAAALIAACAAIAGDLALLIALGTQVPVLLTAPSTTAPGVVLLGLAGLASLIRVALTARGTIRLRQTRAALGTA